MQQREIISGLKHFGCVNIFIPVKKIYKNQIMNQNSLSCERVFVENHTMNAAYFGAISKELLQSEVKEL